MNLQKAQTALSGAMISVVTPATADFELDLDAYRRNLQFMIDRGARAGNAVFLVAAAGGEFPMLSVDQRKQLMKVGAETVNGRVPIAASIQSNSSREAIDLASYAREAGVAIGQLSAPYYYPPTPEDIYRFFRDVAAASDLPIMVYNNWWNTTNMNSETVLRLAEIDGVVAVKWSAPTFAQYLDGYDIFRDRLAVIDNAGQHVTASLHGAAGFITHVGNFWPEHPQRLWELMRAGAHNELTQELAFDRQWHRWTERVVAYTEGEGPFIKAAMDDVGLPSGDPFPPGRAVTQELRDYLRQLFAEFAVPRDRHGPHLRADHAGPHTKRSTMAHVEARQSDRVGTSEGQEPTVESPEVGAHLDVLLARFGDRLTDEQWAKVRERLVTNLAHGEKLRTVTLANAEEPAGVFVPFRGEAP